MELGRLIEQLGYFVKFSKPLLPSAFLRTQTDQELTPSFDWRLSGRGQREAFHIEQI